MTEQIKGTAFQRQQEEARKKIAERRRAAPDQLKEEKRAAPDFEADAGDAAKPQMDMKIVLKRVGDMARALKNAEQRVAEAEAALSKAKADAFKIASIDMPELLREAGLTELKLEDGTKVEIKEDINCGISAERKPEALKWLRDKGFGALIKCEVSVAFGKDDYAKADKLAEQLLKKYGIDSVTKDESVHYQTLKAFIKERRADAEHPDLIPPATTFGVHPYSMAKVTPPKAKGGK